MGNQHFTTQETLMEKDEVPLQSSGSDRAFQKPDLGGHWLGDYGAHGLEIVYIVHEGSRVNAYKVIGDVNVPAGRLSFAMKLDEATGTRGEGDIRIAQHGFVNPSWAAGRIEVKSPDMFLFYWSSVVRRFTRLHESPSSHPQLTRPYFLPGFGTEPRAAQPTTAPDEDFFANTSAWR